MSIGFSRTLPFCSVSTVHLIGPPKLAVIPWIAPQPNFSRLPATRLVQARSCVTG